MTFQPPSMGVPFLRHQTDTPPSMAIMLSQVPTLFGDGSALTLSIHRLEFPQSFQAARECASTPAGTYINHTNVAKEMNLKK